MPTQKTIGDMEAGSITLTGKEAYCLTVLTSDRSHYSLEDAIIRGMEMARFAADGTLAAIHAKLGDMGRPFAAATCECELCKANRDKNN